MALQDNSYQVSGQNDFNEYEQEDNGDSTAEESELNNGSYSAGNKGKKDKKDKNDLTSMDNSKLTPKEEVEVKMVAGVGSTVATAFGAPIPKETIETAAKTNPGFYRKIRDIVKKVLPAALITIVVILIISIVVQAIPTMIVIAVIQATFTSFTTDANTAPPISADSFYGVRIFYKNDELANQTLLKNYNELTFEFLNYIGEIEGVESLEISLPDNIVGTDFSNYSTDFTNLMVCEIVASILNNQQSDVETVAEGEEPQEIVVTLENLNENINLINHFGLTFDDYELITNNLTELFVEKVEEGVNTTDNSTDDIVIFEENYTFDKSAFETSVKNVFSLENFNKYKISCDKLFVKDILAESEVGLDVNGVITNYIYMAKEGAVLENKRYGVEITDESRYQIACVKYENGEASFSNEVIADITWCKTGAEIKENNSGDGLMFIDDNKRYYNEQLEIETKFTCTNFTCFDSQNAEFLAQDNLSVLDAVNNSLASAQICFNVQYNEQQPNFYSVSALPTCNYVGLMFTDVTENGTGTPFGLGDLE